MRIGGVALAPVDDQPARNRAAAADLDHVAQRIRVGRLADERGVPTLAALLRPVEQLDRAVDGGPLLVAGDQQRHRACRWAVLLDDAGERGYETGDAALHVDGAATIHVARHDACRKGRLRPFPVVAGRHDVGMAGEHQVAAGAAEPGVEVLDVRRAVLRKDGALDGGAERCHLPFQDAERACLVRRNGGAADQFGEVGGGIGRQRHGAKG